MSGGLEGLLLAWVRDRREVLDAKSARNAYRCPNTIDESDVGLPSSPPCFSETDDRSKWCDECRERQPHHERYIVAHKAARASFRRLIAAAERASRGTGEQVSR